MFNMSIEVGVIEFIKCAKAIKLIGISNVYPVEKQHISEVKLPQNKSLRPTVQLILQLTINILLQRLISFDSGLNCESGRWRQHAPIFYLC